MPLIAYMNRNFKEHRLAVIDQANDILYEYEAQGYDLTLRQLYYQFVSRGLIANTDREYSRLGSLVNDARLAGLIDWDHITDRTRFLRGVATWDSPGQIIRGAARGYQRDLWTDQTRRVEVWVEKDALIGVVERACEGLRVPYLSCRGYVSQSEMWGASQRIRHIIEDNQRVVIVHLGDHDPSGIDMSRDIEERILMFLANDHFRLTGYDISEEAAVDWAEEHFELRRVALNWDQVQRYQPPPNPAKVTDSRARGYIAEYGRESWELDALEPTVIGELIAAEVATCRDDTKWEEALAEEERERAGLTAVSERWADVVAFLDDGSNTTT